ncbi:MAG: S41 family peptidase [Kofleriaceae bacterium]
MKASALALAAYGAACAAACGAAPAPETERAPPPITADPSTKPIADAIVHVYDALTVKTVAPGDPAPIRQAAVLSLGWTAPIPWTTDPEKDRGLLRGVVRALAQSGKLPADAVLRAARSMGVWSGDLQTYGVDPAGFAALFGLIAGQPVVQPGMTYHQVARPVTSSAAAAPEWAVADLIPGGPAQRAGVARGDVLITIDGAPIVHGWKDFQYLLGARPGIPAKLVVKHAGAERTLTLALAPIATPIVESRMLGRGIGYLRVWTCTHSEVPRLDAALLAQRALVALDRKGVNKLVVDLRGNAGGFPFDLASLFTAADPLMYALVPFGDDRPIAHTKIAPWKGTHPIAVLVDEGTASGAEMVALALREDSGAVVVGEPTAGGLTFPTTEQLIGNVTLSYPSAKVGTAKDKLVQDGNRLTPDVIAPNPTAEDYAAKRDPQLAAALARLTS